MLGSVPNVYDDRNLFKHTESNIVPMQVMLHKKMDGTPLPSLMLTPTNEELLSMIAKLESTLAAGERVAAAAIQGVRYTNFSIDLNRLLEIDTSEPLVEGQGAVPRFVSVPQCFRAGIVEIVLTVAFACHRVGSRSTSDLARTLRGLQQSTVNGKVATS
jgi:hypothetical protein